MSTVIKGDTDMFNKIVPILLKVFDKVYQFCPEEPECLQITSDLLHLVIRNIQPFTDSLYKYFWWYEWAYLGQKSVNGAAIGIELETDAFVGNLQDFADRDSVAFLSQVSPSTGSTGFETMLNILQKVAIEEQALEENNPVNVMHMVKGVMRVVDILKRNLDRRHYQCILAKSWEIFNRIDMGAEAKVFNIKKIFLQLQFTCIYSNPIEYFSADSSNVQ